jgi:hypothetical protein
MSWAAASSYTQQREDQPASDLRNVYRRLIRDHYQGTTRSLPDMVGGAGRHSSAVSFTSSRACVGNGRGTVRLQRTVRVIQREQAW